MSEELGAPVPPSQRMPQRKRSGHVCLYGCQAAVGIFLLLVVLVLFGAYRMVNHLVDEYTDTAPVELPKIEMTEERSNALTKRVEDFGDAVQHDFPVEPLVLTEEDINALIQTNPDLAELNGQVYVTLAEDTVSGQISLPLDKLELGILEDRYLNASVTFEVDLSAGELHVYLADITVKDKSLPDLVKAELEGRDWAADFNTDPNTAKFMENIKSIEVKNGQIVVTPRAPAETPPVVNIVE